MSSEACCCCCWFEFKGAVVNGIVSLSEKSLFKMLDENVTAFTVCMLFFLIDMVEGAQCSTSTKCLCGIGFHFSTNYVFILVIWEMDMHATMCI